jgi:hypothetical protein
MKRTIAGILLLLGLGAGTLFADDGYRHDRRDLRRDEVKISRDGRVQRGDVYDGNYAAAEPERRELRSEYRDRGRDRDRDRDRDGRDIYWDRR